MSPLRARARHRQAGGGRVALAILAEATSIEPSTENRGMSSSNTSELTPNRTKIVATIGPASRSQNVLRELLDAGVDVFRLNFSHGTHEEHSAVLADIRALSREKGRQVAILQDLCGPKMRLGPIPGDLVDCVL